MAIRLIRIIVLAAALLVGAAGGSMACYGMVSGSAAPPGGGSGYSGGSEGGGGRTNGSDQDWGQIINGDRATSIDDLLKDIREGLLAVLKAVLALGALATLVYIVYGLISGQPDSAKKMMVWVAVLSLCYVMVEVFSQTGTGVVAGGKHLSGGSFSYQFGLVRSALQIILSMVCMVTLVVASIHVIGGDQEGSKKLLKWIVVSSAGLSLLSLV